MILQSSKFVILSVLSAVGALSVLTYTALHARLDEREGKSLLLAADLQKATAIKVSQKDAWISIERGANQAWTFKTSIGEEFFASGEQVGSFLKSLNKAKVLRKVFEDPSAFSVSEVGLHAPRLVEVRSEKGVLLDLRGGFNLPGGAGLYFSEGANPSVYLTDRSIESTMAIKYWQLKYLLNIDNQLVKSLKFTAYQAGQQHEEFELRRDSPEETLSVADLKATEEAKSYELAVASSALEFIEFDEKYPKDHDSYRQNKELQSVWERPIGRVEAELFSGRKIELLLASYQLEENTFYLSKIVDLSAGEDFGPLPEDIQVQLQILPKMNEDWLFQIDQKTLGRLFKQRAHFVYDLPQSPNQ